MFPQDQYFFVHEAIAEALLCGNTEVALDTLPGYVENLYSVMPDDESETTNLELQFKVGKRPMHTMCSVDVLLCAWGFSDLLWSVMTLIAG